MISVRRWLGYSDSDSTESFYTFRDVAESVPLMVHGKYRKNYGRFSQFVGSMALTRRSLKIAFMERYR
jgi:hypothetical protein